MPLLRIPAADLVIGIPSDSRQPLDESYRRSHAGDPGSLTLSRSPIMRRVLTAMALLLGLPLSVAACLWDRDTPVDEARGLPEVVAVLTGRFERNPPLFYEMRLERVDGPSPESSRGPRRLRRRRGRLRPPRARRRGDLVDGEEAGATRRARRLADPRARSSLYRYHANLGTFLVHRWARQGADRAKIDEVKAARDEIARAMEINPNCALRPREIPVAGAEMDHRPAEDREPGGRTSRTSSVGASTTSTASRPSPRRPTMPCGGSPGWSSSGMPGRASISSTR